MRRWRRSVVDALLRAVAVVLLVAASWWIYQGHERLVVPYLLLVAVTFGLSFLPAAWYRLRVIWLLGAVVGAGLLSLAVYGLTPNSYTAFAVATVIATILVGWKCGALVASAITVSLGPDRDFGLVSRVLRTMKERIGSCWPGCTPRKDRNGRRRALGGIK